MDKNHSNWFDLNQMANDVIAVKFKPGTKKSRQDKLLKDAGCQPLRKRIGFADTHILVLSIDPQSKVWANDAIKQLNKTKQVNRALRVFENSFGYSFASDRLVVRTDGPIREFGPQFKKYGCRLFKRKSELGSVRLLANEDSQSVFEELKKCDWVKDIYPDFVTVQTQHSSYTEIGSRIPAWIDSNAPWNHHLRSIKAYEPWGVGYIGKPNIRIAIIDSGVDTQHSDLSPSILETYDAVDEDTYQEPGYGNHHGTAVAGVAAGISPDGNGIQGIGGGCSIISIQIAGSAPDRGENYYNVSPVPLAIRLAWDFYKADVICLSFALHSYCNDVHKEILYALGYGRNGAGTIIVAAAGNNGGPVLFPGDLPEIITVSATNQNDEFKTWNSSDGENWASSFGPEVDIAAPGVQIPSAVNTMQDQYMLKEYGYFSGTSLAAPMVAGMAGLILSINPELDRPIVQTIIRESADKIGNASDYQDGRNDYVGYGRINLAEAVKLAGS